MDSTSSPDDPLALTTDAIATNEPVDDPHHALTETEIAAVPTATETPGIRQLIQSYDGPIAIVSNNATEAIQAWLAAATLGELINIVIGRDPRCMNPDPWALPRPAEAIDRSLTRCVFVGDSLTEEAPLDGQPIGRPLTGGASFDGVNSIRQPQDRSPDENPVPSAISAIVHPRQAPHPREPSR